MTPLPATAHAARQAFSMAGLTASDIDVAEVDHFITGIELNRYTDVGFGRSKLVDADVTTYRRRVPVDASGRLKAKGPPPGTAGVTLCVEPFAQLCGGAVNQVDSTRIGLAHNMGGSTAVSAVTVLEGTR